MKPLVAQVAAIRAVAPLIKEFEFAPVGQEFPAFSPGAHIVIDIKTASRRWQNPYSLISDPRQPSTYKIAVRKEDKSRGGSHYLHEQIHVGDQITLAPPANYFLPPLSAKKLILVAGGVGITPFLSYLPELERKGVHFELHYLFDSAKTGAYADELQKNLGDRLVTYNSQLQQRCHLPSLLAGQPIGTHLSVCGPAQLIEEVRKCCTTLSWPNSQVHIEQFLKPAAGEVFKVELAKSGKTLEVAPEQSLLEALEQADVAIAHQCRGGVCGQCFTPVINGQPLHRDSFLTEDQKNSNSCIMPCVSRSKGTSLVLDI